MDDNQRAKYFHDINNKVATIDASLGVLRIYLRRLKEAPDNAATTQGLDETAEDLLLVCGE